MPAIADLIKGTDIVSGAILPFGQFFEEAQESRNKYRQLLQK
jgi:hypothetical protein